MLEGTLTTLDMGQNRRERWKRHVVPCRFRQQVPKPALRIILPLTSPRTPIR
jgi:hypothetical protein